MPGQAVVGERFVEALAARDFDSLKGLMDADVRMRALVPPGVMEERGPDAAVALYSEFLGSDLLELASSDVTTMADRTRVTYRMRIRLGDGEPLHVFEQVAFCVIVDERLKAIDLVCSGYRPCV